MKWASAEVREQENAVRGHRRDGKGGILALWTDSSHALAPQKGALEGNWLTQS